MNLDNILRNWVKDEVQKSLAEAEQLQETGRRNIKPFQSAVEQD